MIDLQPVIHYSLHLIFPFVIAYFFFRKNWKMAGIFMLITMVIDFDHLLASPVFDARRCSIGFHPLHTIWAILIYLVMFIFKPLRIISAGLLLHIFIDLIDCLWIFHKCHKCFLNSEIYKFLNETVI